MYKLCIVDDDALTLKSFVSSFDWEAMGFKLVSTFSSSAKCLEYIKQNSVDALLTDIRMPHISGLELAKQCSEIYPNIGIVLISAYSSFEYARQAIRCNVIDYILKPVDDDEFEMAMANLKNYLDKISGNNAATNQLDTITQRIEQYFEQHYSENITATTVAKHLMISPDYFSFYFKKHTGQNFSLYLRNYRLEKACELLKSTDLKITTILEKIGYKSMTHFYESFAEKYGVTPSDYRKNNIEK